MAHKAIGMEPRVGAMLGSYGRCLRLRDQRLSPVASVQATDNPELKAVAAEDRDMLARSVRAA